MLPQHTVFIDAESSVSKNITLGTLPKISFLFIKFSIIPYVFIILNEYVVDKDELCINFIEEKRNRMNFMMIQD
jgi:hypothetical protein